MKTLKDKGIGIAMDETPGKTRIINPADRIKSSIQLLSKFLQDGKIRGLTPEGKVFEHLISEKLSRTFLTGLDTIDLRGSQ